MASELSRITIPAPNKGIWDNGSHVTMPVGYAADINNFLPHSPGRLVHRGPLGQFTGMNGAQDLGTSALKCLTGVWLYDDIMLTSRVAAAGDSVLVKPWIAPWFKQASGATLSQAGVAAGDGRFVNLAVGGAVTSLTPTVDNAIGPRYTRLGSFVYGPSFSSAGAATSVNGGFQRPTRVLRWDGTAVMPTVLTNGPTYVQDAIAHYQRLFVCGAVAPAGAADGPSTLYYTRPGGSPTNLAADWTDPVSGLVNKIVVDSQDNDSLVGMAKVGTNLVLFKRRSVHMLYGSGPSTFTVKPLTRDYGCIDVQSICEVEGGVVFASEQGLMFFDGTSFLMLSESISSEWSALVLGDYIFSPKREVRVQSVAPGYMYVTFQTGTNTVAQYLVYLPFKAWVRVSTEKGSLNRIVRGPTRTAAIVTEDSVMDAMALVVPEIGYMVATKVQDVNSAGASGIPAVLRVFVSPGGVSAMSQLHRVILDYMWITTGDEGPQVQLDTMANTGSVVTLATWHVDPVASPGSGKVNARHHHDCFFECGRWGHFVITVVTGSIGSDNYADVGLQELPSITSLTTEFQVTRENHG